MLWVEKIKTDASGVLKEYPVSVCSFFLACVCVGIHEDLIKRSIFEFFYIFLFAMTPCFVAAEACHSYSKKREDERTTPDVKGIFPYLVYICIALVFSFSYSYIFAYRHNEAVNKSGSLYYVYTYITRIVVVYAVISLISALYFFFKASERSLEQYSVRAFLGVLKAGLLYGVVSLGSLCLIYAFNELLFNIRVMTLIEMIIMGLFLFPSVLVGLSRISDNLLRFSKILMGYVLPAIVAIACGIVYIYIIKIIIVRSMPSNEAFGIMTGIFVSGLFIWTTAQGCTEDPLHKYLLVFPIVFSPFIVVQIISLSMRISQYGLTNSRYMGVLLIVFELVYVFYYAVCLARKKGVGGFLFLMLMVPFVVYFLIPGINVYAAITASQAKIVDTYLEEIESGAGSSITARSVRSAMNSIKEQGSIEGMKYVEKLKDRYSEDKLKVFDSDEYDDDFTSLDIVSVYVYNNNPVVNIEGYRYMKEADVSIYTGATDPEKIPVYEDYDRSTILTTVNLKDIILELKNLENDEADYEKKIKIIDRVVPLENGAGLYLKNLNAEIRDDGLLESVSYSAYYLYND